MLYGLAMVNTWCCRCPIGYNPCIFMPIICYMDLLWLILGDEGCPIGYDPYIWVYIILCTTLYGMHTP